MSDNPAQKIAARIRMAEKARKLLGTDDWDPIDLLMEVALGAPLTQAPDLADGSLAPILLPAGLMDRVDCAKTLASLVHPKIKMIELTGKDGAPLPLVNFYIPANGRDAT